MHYLIHVALTVYQKRLTIVLPFETALSVDLSLDRGLTDFKKNFFNYIFFPGLGGLTDCSTEGIGVTPFETEKKAVWLRETSHPCLNELITILIFTRLGI